MLTSGAYGGASSFPTSLARYLVPTTSGIVIEGASELAMPITLRSHLSFSLGRVDVQWKRVGKRETG